MNDLDLFAPIAAAFEIDGTLVSASLYGNGHINRTYLGRYATSAGERRLIHQQINDRVFPDIAALMENVGRVVRHAPTLVPGIVRTREGHDLLRTSEGAWWRTYEFVQGRSYDTVDSPEQAYRAAKAFGRFIAAMSSLGGERLREPIAAFHDTNGRLAALRDAIERDPRGRASAVEPEIAYCLQNMALADGLAALQRGGIARECIVHNDTKINNVLLDGATDGRDCVIDLDLVMPGLALYDFGDLVRTATARAGEDERDLRLVEVDVELFTAVAHGFADGAGAMLTVPERDHLVTAGRVMSFECGVRFLSDHLMGDAYFTIHHPGQNLDRARVQFALVKSLARRETELQAMSW